jgi:LysR family hca operon transcriptional activator
MPGDHRLASREAVDPKELAGEPFLGMSETAPVLRRTIADYFRRSGLDLSPAHEVDYLSMAISLVASTRAVTLLPIYALNFLPPSVISRPLTGDVPTVELVLGYHKANTSPLLRLFLSKLDDLIERVSDAAAAAGQLAHQ